MGAAVSTQPRDEQGRWVEAEAARRERIGREHGALVASLIGGASPETVSSGAPSPQPPERSSMNGGWLGTDIHAHERQREAEREAWLDEFFPYLTGRPRAAGSGFKPYALEADDE